MLNSKWRENKFEDQPYTRLHTTAYYRISRDVLDELRKRTRKNEQNIQNTQLVQQ